MGRPNLFDFATSELSQDAFLCWLAALAEHDDPALRELGQSFLAWLWRLARGSVVPTDKVRLLAPPKRQINRVDVLVEAEIAGQRALFLIEDKTDTSQHSGQLERYLTATGESDVVVPIYFKTGYHFGVDLAAAASGYVVVGLTEWVDFLSAQTVSNDILSDYRAFMRRKLVERTEALVILLTPSGFTAFKHAFVQYEFMTSLVERCPDSLGKARTYKGNNRSGSPWTQHIFAQFSAALPGSFEEAIFYRLDQRQQDGRLRWYLSPKQYAQIANASPEARSTKLARLEKYRQAFKLAQQAAEGRLTFSRPTTDRVGRNESEIGIIFFDEGLNSTTGVLEHFPAVHRAFLDQLRT